MTARIIASRRAVLVGAFVFVVLAVVAGRGVVDRLVPSSIEVSGSPSEAAADILREEFGTGTPNVLMLVEVKQGTVDDRSVEAVGRSLTSRLAAEEGVTESFSYWTLGSPPPLRSLDGTKALVAGHLDEGHEDFADRTETITRRFTTEGAEVRVSVGGAAEVDRQLRQQVEEDAERAEVLAFPLLLALLVVVFRSAIAALLPLAVGILSVVGTLVVLRITTEITEVSSLAISLTTALSLGLAIDYSLLVVVRYREERQRGLTREQAILRSQATAGRTVLVSAVVVSASLSALLIFPMPFLRSLALAGVAVVLLAAVATLVILPALLATLGSRIDRSRRARKEAPSGRVWHWLAQLVMTHPVLVAVITVSFLVTLAVPFSGAVFGLPDDRVLPESTPARRVHETIRNEFSSKEIGPLAIVPAERFDAGRRRAELHEYAARLSQRQDVARVDAASGSYIDGSHLPPSGPAYDRFSGPNGTWLSVVPAVEPLSPAGERLVRAIREVPSPFDELLVGGRPAELVDLKETIARRAPVAGALIAVTTFVLLFFVFGSPVVALKALLLNLLSLAATFGAMVWVFQEGNLSGPLDFTATGTLDTTTPVVMFCLAFGLSMDYEIFLLSRIREEYALNGDNRRAVAIGLATTGGLVTAAATLLAVVFVALATSGISLVKLLAVGLTLAIVMDATVIRCLLMPAFMRLLGDANWWAPAWSVRLRRRLARVLSAP